jgi:DNA primase (bacterial type)
MTIQAIKSSLSIIDVLHRFRLKIENNNRVLCPFHDDKIPSLQIYPKTNSYCCFSTKCKVGSGDALELLHQLEGQDKHAAILIAKEMLGDIGPSAENLNEVFKKLQTNFKRSEVAKKYAISRGLEIENLEIGYNAGSYKDLKNCLVFPLKNQSGEIVSMYGRSIKSTNKSRHYYQKGRSGIYPEYPKPTTKQLILTEGIIDAVSLIQNLNLDKSSSVMALYGVKVLKAEQEKSINELKHLEEIVFYFDGDAAGAAAVEKWEKYFKELKPGLKISQVNVLKGEDVNSMLVNHEGDVLGELMKSRKILNGIKPKPKTKGSGKLNTNNPKQLIYEIEDLIFTMLGGINLRSLDKLRVTLKTERRGDDFNRLRHSLDLYNDDQLNKYSLKASDRLDVSSERMRKSLSLLVDSLENHRVENPNGKPKKVELSAQRERIAIKYLKASKLLKRTNKDIESTGVVGERINRLLMYLCFTSRLMGTPLHIITMGGSGTGKTYLQEKVGALMPPEHVLQFTATTDNALYYIKDGDLRNKLILIEDIDGAEGAMYILRELMSKKWVSKLVAQKDARGKTETVSVTVFGPISLSGTTTREMLYEDNANRSLLIYPDDSPAHQEAIMDQQRKISSGQISPKLQANKIRLLQDVQRVLKPIRVINPFAEQLRIPPTCFKPLRTNAHYLHFIEAVTFYHQYQREVKVNLETEEEYIETTIEDIAAANELLKDVLLAKSDELVSKACRDFYEKLKQHLKENKSETFSSSEIRKALRVAPTTVNRYLGKLKQYGYVVVKGGNRYNGGLKYELGKGTDYASMKKAVNGILDELLAKIKSEEKMSEPVTHQ